MNAVEPAFPVVSPKRIGRVGNAAELSRRLRHLRYLIRNPIRHVQYVWAMARHAERGLLVNSAYRRYKYLGDYIALSFPRALRRRVILSHYRLVERRVAPAAAQTICADGVELWALAFDEHRAAIRLANGEAAPMEGEWQLRFLLDGSVIATLSFVFAALPDHAVEGRDVCIVGGVQGAFNARAEIRSAAKANCEISPTTMLIIAVKGVAAALGVRTVLGVAQQQQVVRRYATDGIKADYDAIWISEGASAHVNGLYLLSHQLIERDLMDVPRSHRRRTKLKRQRKAEILAEITETARARLLRLA